MTTKLVADGDKVEMVASVAALAGAGMLFGAGGTAGGIVGAVMKTVAIGEVAVLSRRGIHNLPKLTTDVVLVGSRLWWDDTNKRLTLTATSNTFAGWAHAAAGNGVTTVDIILSGGAAA